MKLLIFSVKDIVAGQFSDLKIFNNKEVALRWYDGLLVESKIAKDLQFYLLGTYEIETGLIEPCFEFVKGGAINE